MPTQSHKLFPATALAFGLTLLTAAPAALAQTYWRVDTGYSWSQDADIRDKNFALDGFICGDAACNGPGRLNDVDNSLILGVGLGYRFNPNVRADITVGYRGWYEIDDTDAFPSTFSGDVSSTNVMLNVYYDYVIGGSWRPYIGAGIGWTRNKVDDIKNVVPAFGTITVPGGTKSGLAWSLMAGLAYPINDRLMVEIGYRYIDLGKIETDSGTVSPAFLGTYSGTTGKLKAHEVTLGLRF